MNNKLKFTVHIGLFLLLMFVSTNSTFAQLANVKPEANLSTELDAEKDWKYLDDFKSFFCDAPEYCEIVDSFNMLEYVKYSDSIKTVKNELAKSFLNKYPQSEHYDEALKMFLSVYFEPYFISNHIADSTLQFLKSFPKSLLAKPIFSPEASKFYRALPIDSDARELWLKKGQELVAKVLSSDADMEHKATLEMFLLSRDMRIAKNLFWYMGLEKLGEESDYWKQLGLQYWERNRQQLEDLLFKYPDSQGIVPYITWFINSITKEYVSPELKEVYWKNFYQLTDKNNPSAERLAFQSLRIVAKQNLVALKSFKDFDYSKPLQMQFSAMDGSQINLEDMRGKVVLIDFWSFTCPGCILEMQQIQAMYDKYHDLGFEVIGVASHGDNEKEKVLKILEKAKVDWPQRLDKGKEAAVSYHSLYNIHTYPTVWMLDKNGVVVDKRARGKRLEPLIRQYLGLDN